VDKALHLNATFLTETCDFFQGKFPGGIDPCDAHPGPEAGCGGVGGIGLGAEVQGDMGGPFPGQGDDAGVADNEGIGPACGQFPEVGCQFGYFRMPWVNIAGHIHPGFQAVGKLNGLFNVFEGKVVGKVSERKILATEIDGVCAIEEGDFQFFHVACRGKQFNGCMKAVF
jgi:hypothetical protein